jgi:hypothetical protein
VLLAQSSFTSGVVASTHKKDNAHLCFIQNRVTTIAITIQRNPSLLTEHSRLERAVSIMSSFADLAAPPPRQRFIDDQIHAGSRFSQRSRRWARGTGGSQPEETSEPGRALGERDPVACLLVAAATARQRDVLC